MPCSTSWSHQYVHRCHCSLAESLPSSVQSHQPAGQPRPYNPSPYLPPPSAPAPNNQAQAPPQPAVRQNNLHHTTTVRNLVNLKKQTLTLTPRKDDPETLDISFCIDAVQECMCDTLHSIRLVLSRKAVSCIERLKSTNRRLEIDQTHKFHVQIFRYH